MRQSSITQLLCDKRMLVIFHGKANILRKCLYFCELESVSLEQQQNGRVCRVCATSNDMVMSVIVSALILSLVHQDLGDMGHCSVIVALISSK